MTAVDPQKFYKCERITLAAGEWRVLTYDAPPDQFLVTPLLDSAIINRVEIVPVGGAGGGSIQLRGTGYVVVPGISRQFRVENFDLVPRTLVVTAQKGYPPVQVNNPVSLAKATSADIQSQMKVESVAVTSPLSFTYNHVGRYVLVLAAYQEFVGVAPRRTINSVSIGGAAGALLGQASQIGNTAASYWAYGEARWVDQSSNGPLSAVVTFSGAPPAISTATLYLMLLSYADGIRTGNFGSASISAAPWTISYVVVGQSDASVVFSLPSSFDSTPAGPGLTDTAAATIFDAIHSFPGVTANADMVGLLDKVGKGSQTLAYAFSGGARQTLLSVGVEVLPA